MIQSEERSRLYLSVTNVPSVVLFLLIFEDDDFVVQTLHWKGKNLTLDSCGLKIKYMNTEE